MHELVLPANLFDEARATFEAGAASKPPSLAVDDATVEAVRAVLNTAREREGTVTVPLSAPLLEAFKGCYMAGGQARPGADDTNWDAILAAIQAAEGMRRPGVA